MSQKISSGLLPYRKTSEGSLEVLLAHYGGPLWARKDLGAWTVVKGEVDTQLDLSSSVDRSPAPKANLQTSALHETGQLSGAGSEELYTNDILLATAKREFQEETGISLPLSSLYEGEDEGGVKFIPLGEIIQRGGKTVHAWAFLGNTPDNFILKSGMFEMEWPPRSGKIQQFPEIDKAEWFSLETARQKINQAQVAFLERLSAHLSS